MSVLERIPNPRYLGSPACMADGRLFTDYRSHCKGTSFDEKEKMQRGGQAWVEKDRALAAKCAATVGSVDTMVPELTKRVCTWNGCTTLPAHAVGIGQGRLYMPGLTELVAEDPDLLAMKTAFPFGTFPANPPSMDVPKPVSVMPLKPNRYSAPYATTKNMQN